MSKKNQSENVSMGPGKVPSYYWTENAVANSYNRLKGKMFNLIESTIVNETQCAALKGLVKDFANTEFRRCIEDMRYEAKQAGLITEENPLLSDSIPPLSVFLTEDEVRNLERSH